jgi:asparagine synthase (glutamine-hydrolysing)
MTIPDRLKLQRKEGKIILKHIMEKYLPHDILYRPKQGFNLPIDRWFRKELYGYLNETLSDEALRRHGFFNPAAVRKLIRMHKESKGNYGIHLYALLSFQLWYETFIHQ